MRAMLATCITAVMVFGSAGSAIAMCGGGMMGGSQAATSAGKSQCGGSMSMGGMKGMPSASKSAGDGSKAEADAHAGMDMSGSSKGGMGGMMMGGGMKMAGGCCCGGMGGRSGGMCGGGGAMNMQEDHTKDPLLTDPMWDEKPGADPKGAPAQPK